MPRLWEIIQEGRVRARQSDAAVTVPTTGVQLLGHNPNRVAYEISNLDATNFAVIAHRPITGATIGKRLGSGGGYYSAKYEELGNSVGNAVFAAFDTAQGTLHVTEWEAY